MRALRRLLTVVAVLVVTLPWVRPAAGAAAMQTQLRTEKVADGIYAILQPTEQRFDDSNSAIIILDDGVLLVDTQNSPLAARAVLQQIRALTDRPVRWVVNTHWHGDHVQGNEVYRTAFPNAEFIAHRNTAEDIRERAMPAHEEDLANVPGWLESARAVLASGVDDGQQLTGQQMEQLRARISRRERYFEGVKSVTSFVVPTRLFDDSLIITSGRRVELRHFAGHTRGDVAVWIPDARVLISGDLLDDLPFTGHGSPGALLATLQAFDALDFAATIPGHGAVRRDHEHMRNVQALFSAIVEQAGAAARAGRSLDDTERSTDVRAHRDWFVTDEAAARYWDFFVAEGIRRAWEEGRG